MLTPSMSSNHRPMDSETTVLVLEDQKGLADLYATWLSADYTVRTTYTASDARRVFDESIDIALVDRRLPIESGDDVLRWIRQTNSRCRTAMVTAVNPDFDIIDIPLDDYLVKPVDKAVLVDTIEALRTQREYDEIVRELYALIAKKTRIEQEKSRRELSDCDEYEELLSKLAETYNAANESILEIKNAGTLETVFRGMNPRDLV